MVELIAPEGLAIDAAAAAIAATLPVRERRSRAHERCFYDSFDGRVRAAGLLVVHEDGDLALRERDSGRLRGREPLRRPTRPLLAEELPPGELRAALGRVLGPRALLVGARVHARERALDVLDGEAKTVVRATLAAPAIIGPDHATRILRPRVTLTAVRGYDGELEQAERVLMAELALDAAPEALVDEALRASGRPPEGTSSKVGLALGRGVRTDVAAAGVLGRLTEIIAANRDGTLRDIDTEFLHDLRVAVRRSRAVARALRGAFAAQELAHYRAEFRWVQQATGRVRDLDIHLLEFDGYRELVGREFSAGLTAVEAILATHRRRAFLAMCRSLRSERFRGLMEAWPACLVALPGTPADDRRDALAPIEAVAGRRIRRLYRSMVDNGAAISEQSPAQDLHDLRKQGKELRYLLELFGGLYPGEVVRPLVRSLKELQAVLGRHQDRSVQVEMLRSIQDEVGARDDGVRALVAMGALARRLLDDERAARDEFAEGFAAFAARGQRRRVKEAIR